MKQITIFKTIFASLCIFATVFILGNWNAVVLAQNSTTQEAGNGSCSDGRDNDIPPDNRADWNGAVVNGVELPPDPSCINKDSKEVADDVASGSLIPCTNKCDLGSVFALLNNLIEFFIKIILFPIAVIMFVYAGFTYITAAGNPGKKVKVRTMIGHLIGGMILVLCAWVIVKTLLVVVGYSDNLYFFE